MIKGKNMRSYGRSLVEENGFSVVEVLDTNTAGVSVLIGYTILDPDGKVLARTQSSAEFCKPDLT